MVALSNRLRVLNETHLLDSPPEHAFDRLTRLASRLVGAPTALVSLVDERRQFFKSALGLGEPWASKRETPLSHSFCQYVARDNAPLVVEDARESAELRDNGAVHDLGVVAYAGMPLVVQDQAIGALCVIDSAPRRWTSDELQTLSDLAEAVVSEIELRIALRQVDEERALVNVVLDNLAEGVVAIGRDRRVVLANAAARRLLAPPVVGETMSDSWREGPRSMRPDGQRLTAHDDEIGRALRGETTDGFDFSIEAPFGEAVRIEASARPVFDPSGKLLAAVGVYRDVTGKHAQSALYSTLARSIPKGAVLLFDHGIRCIAIDGGLARRDGLDRRKLIGRNLAELVRLEPGSPLFAETLSACHRTLEGETMELDLFGPSRVLHIRTAPVRDPLGEITSGFMLALDVTEERRTQNEVKKNEQIYRAIAQNLPDGAVLMLDRNLRIVTAEGPILGRAMGMPSATDLIGKTAPEVASSQNRGRLADIYGTVLKGESHRFEIERGDHFYDITAVPIFDDKGVSNVLVSILDVSKRKAELLELQAARRTLEAQALELQEASVTDALTGLLNRRGFSLIAEKEIKAAVRAKRELLLFFVDLNGMKAINDTLGHAAGDEALVATGKLLRGVFREADVIARLGGDEFVVLATDAIAAAAPSITTRISGAVECRNSSESNFELSLSVGVSVFDPTVPISLDELLSQADARMYAEKQSRRRGGREVGGSVRGH